MASSSVQTAEAKFVRRAIQSVHKNIMAGFPLRSSPRRSAINSRGHHWEDGKVVAGKRPPWECAKPAASHFIPLIHLALPREHFSPRRLPFGRKLRKSGFGEKHAINLSIGPSGRREGTPPAPASQFEAPDVGRGKRWQFDSSRGHTAHSIPSHSTPYVCVVVIVAESS